MAEINKFKDDWNEFYKELTTAQQIHFLQLIVKHACFQLNDIANEIGDLQVIV